MGELLKLKKIRGGHRGYTSKIIAKIEDGNDDEKSLRQIEMQLKEKLEILGTLDKQILDLVTEKELASEETEEDECLKEIEECGSVQEKINMALLTIQEKLATKEQRTGIRRSDSQISLDSLNSTSSQTRKVRAKLPKLELTKFSGRPQDWQEFWDGFVSAVHGNEELSTVDKFSYLKHYLADSAKKVISGFELTEKNYDAALELLQERFAKPSLIRKAHIKDLMNLPVVFSERNVTKLRELYDSIEVHFRGLQALNIDMETYSGIVVDSLMEKIPESVRLTMIRGSTNYEEWNIEEMLAAFKEELEIREKNTPIFKGKRDDEMKMRPPGKTPLTSGSALLTLQNQRQDGGSRNKNRNCVFCGEEHEEAHCSTVSSLEERKKFILKAGRCFSCLGKGHRSFECRVRNYCKDCKQKHHASICEQKFQRAKGEKETPKPSVPPPNLVSTNSCVGNVGNGGRAALQTAQAFIKGKQQDVRARVLFDTGSHRTFVTQGVVDRAGLSPIRKEILGIKTFGSNNVDERERDVVQIELFPLRSEKPTSVKVNAIVVEHISEIPNEHPEILKQSYPHLANIWFSDVSCLQDSLVVDVLVGIDSFYFLQEDEVIRGEPADPVAVKTKLGWVISGPLTGKTLASSEHVNLNIAVACQPSVLSTSQADRDMHKLWDLETLGITSTNEVHDDLLDNVSFTGQRYSVKLPWKVGHKPLPSNFAVSLSRLKGQIKRLRNEPEVLKAYDQIIKEQLEQNVIERVAELECPEKQHYLPHHAVIRNEAETTKVRIVYDASSKEKKSGTSLNDCLHVGPPLMPLLFDILVRFREFKVPMVADIEKAFLNVEVDPADRDVLRFLWVRDIHDPNSPIEVFHFNRCVFGVNTSPFLLNAVLRNHIAQYQQEDPKFAVTLANNFYVDDLVFGAENISDAEELFHKAKERMKAGGFHLRKWKSCEPALQAAFKSNEQPQQKVRNLEIGDNEESFAKETLGSKTEEGKTKVLGISWDTEADKLVFDLTKLGTVEKDAKVTKRTILSSIAKLFDPLGLVSPVIVNAKVLFQEICIENLGWDDELPEDKRAKWESLVSDLNDVGRISLPRCLYDDKAGKVKNCSLHGFADASKKAYCAMIYLVYETEEEIVSNLVCAKTRVAPLKELSIPRLELMSARILATLMNVVLSALNQQVQISTCRFWLDSKTALYWIKNTGHWRQFVQHRVDEILTVTEKRNWGHCAGVCNPADLGSRGVFASALQTSRLWWHGPHWLVMGKEHWPTELLLEDTPEIVQETKKSALVATAVGDKKTGISNIIDIDRFSSLERLLKVTSWVVRFIENLKAKKKKQPINRSEVSAKEMFAAEKYWVLDVQSTLRKEPKFNQLKVNLGLFEEEQVLRCKGRLNYSDLEFDGKFPIILPRENRFTELVVFACHQRVFHNGLKSTLAELRSRYWVPQGRQFVKRLLRKCFICRKVEGKSYAPPQTADLPDFRVKEAPPFVNVGIDFAGPLFHRSKSGEMEKCYVVLYVCCTSRAIHLDLVEDLAGPTFVRSMQRFTARRGTPDLINSDNAKTFKFTHRLLERLAHDHSVVSFLQAKRITWKFNMERSPWWGGHFERLVGSVKRCLKKVLGNARLRYDELLTLLTQVESTLNSRPLTYIYDELGYHALTPFHLMHGRRLSALSDHFEFDIDALEEDPSSFTRRFAYLVKKLDHFWSRWRLEYLADLREVHHLNKGKQGTVHIGEMVLVKEENIKRGNWKMGVIIELIKGKDGIARGAKVRIGQKVHSSAQNINNDVLMENEKEIHKMLDRRELHHIFGTEDVAQVPAYETVHPFTVDENSKRSVNSRRSLHHTDPMFVHFTAFGFDFHLNLTLNKHLVPEGQVIEHHTNDGIKRYIGAPNTYSIGNVVSDDKSIVALDHSNGLSGMIMRDGEMYFMAPAPPQIANNDKPTDGHGAHIIYKKSALPSSHPLKDASCGVQSKGQSNSKDIPERFRRASSSVGSSSARPEKIMELMIVADKSAIVSRGKDFIATYLLALANMVAGFYKDPSLEYPITVAVTRVVLVETDELSFKGDYRLIDKLGKFYSWFMRNNPADDSDPNHVDIGALVTRHPCRINTKGQPKCSNIHGWAAVGRGCGRSTAHSVSLDFGPLSSTTIAHEIGHNLGLPHDGKGSSRTCPSGYIMAANSDAKWSQIWSKCNSRYLNNLLLRPSATTCFDDKPALPVLTNASFQLYGQVFNGQKQCDLQFVGKGYKFYKEGCAVVRCAIRTQIDELDSYLTIHKTQWVAAQGTACNRDQPHHWCIHGECVRDGTKIEAPPYPVNGGWSEYSDYTDCNQQCGGGVQWKERTCTNPRPQHRGKPCKGKAKKYWRRCNMHACTAGMKAPLTRHQRCLAAGCANCRLDPKDPCRLACGKKVLTIYDGSHPTDKSKSRDICIEGSLQKLSCDLTFNHTIPDRCNVCGGDGTTCKRIVGKVDGGKNYHHHLIDFPAGTMNIHVQELGPTKSFLGVKVGDSNDYLYKIPDWSLTKNVAGTKLIYTMKSFNYADQIKIPGTINIKLRLYFYKYTDPSKGVSWTYYTPSGNGNKSSAEYIIGDWGECSKTCAGGIKKRKLGCRRVDDRSPLSLKYCESLPSRKLASTKDCNTHNCPTKWKITRWDKCSKECGGGGEHKRRLLCSELRRDGAYHTVSDTLCKHIKQPKILLKRKCNHMKCPATWAIGRWSQCSKSCGRGTQTRSVSCQRINEDDKVSIAHVHECMALKGEGKAGPKPQSMRACASDTPCPKWTIKYSACSRSCDGGTQQAYAACIRMGTILQESACAAGNKPNVASTPSKTCNTHACNAREWVSKEGTCSVACGNGIIPITVTCQRVKDNVTVADALCLKSKKPKTTRPCNAGVCVDAYGWKIVKGFCSVTCGKGTTTDRAVCIRKRDTVRVEDTRCVISRKPTVGKAKECTMPKCPETYSWSVTYGPCSSSCGEGVKQPIVKCQKDRDGVVVDDSKCQVFKPQPGMIPCNSGPCPTGYIWKTFWGSCSSKCGKGTQTSYYKCYLKSTQTELSDSYCATITKPAVATKGCSSICRWVPNPDGPCLAKCGKGKKFTTLRCEDESKNELAVKHCSKTPVGTVVLPECTNLKPCIPVAPLVTDVPKFYSVGCYNDNRNSNDRFIPNFIANFRSSIDWKNMLPTIVKCARRVAKVNKKYTYFAIQFYGECYAGDDSVVNRFSRNGPSKNCYMGTGGPHVNFIYRFGSPMQTTQLPAVKPLGCFADNKISPRPLPVLLGNFKTLIKNNGQFDESTAVKIIAECAKAASKRGYKLFGIQSYSECWSGPAAKNTYKKDGLSKSCPLNVGGFKSFYAYIFIS